MMTDPVQRTSSLPLPTYQTAAGNRDPLPETAPRFLEKNATERAETGLADKSDAFSEYLDQSGITVLEAAGRRKQANAADLLSQDAVYVAPGVAIGT